LQKHLETCPQTRDEIPIPMGQARPSNSVGEISTDENEPESEDLRRSIQMLEAIVQNISEDTEQFRRDLRQMRSCLLNVLQKLEELRVAEHEFNTVLANQENLLQQLASLKQQVSESQQSSFEGTYLWVINDVGTKMSRFIHFSIESVLKKIINRRCRTCRGTRMYSFTCNIFFTIWKRFACSVVLKW